MNLSHQLKRLLLANKYLRCFPPMPVCSVNQVTPLRSVKVYKDKEADWVKRDKNLLSAYRKGRDQYVVSCGACHQADGKGLPHMAPTLAKSDWVTGDAKRLIGVAVHGLMGPIKVNGKSVEGVPPIMPPHGFMKDEQLASILTYVRNAWGNQGKDDIKRRCSRLP
jgi:mono/diheme cytochrome c family protein